MVDSSAGAPPWDQECRLDAARSQVRNRAEAHRDERRVDVIQLGWSPIATLPSGAVVVADTVLWRWTDDDLRRLSQTIRAAEGVLVFIEPTAGLGLKRAVQLAAGPLLVRRLGHHFNRDLPADLRAAGLTVTTQVRLGHGLIGNWVRGEARHFPGQSGPSAD